jgi:surface antigen
MNTQAVLQGGILSVHNGNCVSSDDTQFILTAFGV